MSVLPRLSALRGRPALLGLAAALLAAAWMLSALRPAPRPASGLDLQGLGALPVSFEGRVKPLDSVARHALVVLSGRQTLRHEGRALPATEWLLGLLSEPARWEDVPVVRVDHPDVRALLGEAPPAKKLFSFRECVANAEEVARQAWLASNVPADARSLYQRRVLQLYRQLELHQALALRSTLHVVPPVDGAADWATQQEAALRGGPRARELARRFDGLLATARPRPPAGAQARPYVPRPDDARALESRLAAYAALVEGAAPADAARARLEVAFNRVDPFQKATALYVLAFVLTCLSWLGWRERLGAAALGLVVAALAAHTVGLGLRVHFMGRPPVTNLYSSAVFIGWACVLASIALEAWTRRARGVGTLAAALTGFLPLLVADGLATGGDTMAMLQAVLDTNFWLATHVIVITLGYSATFLAGFLAIVYVVRGLLTRSLDAATAKDLARMVYGTTCFALLFSFLGTVLGGIWADQSWGRFWGWDPKENGALVLVLWTAMTLHGVWGGVYRDRGLVGMAIAGNVVVAWSWFGTNMLGVGLHSYGFMDSAMGWLLAFAASQAVLVGLTALPPRLWRSPCFAPREVAA